MIPHKIVVIGYGRIGLRHTQILESSENFNLVGISELDKNRRSVAENLYGSIVYSNTLEMINKVRPDIAVICTESGNHYKDVLEIAGKVKVIVVEKPMALRVEHAREMTRICKELNSSLFVVKQNRYNLPIQKTREIFENNLFGKLTLATVRVRWCRDQNYFDLDEWRGTWKLDGGVLANQASHHLDILQWFLGDIDTVFAYGSTVLTKIETEETMICILKSKSGVLGIIEATNTARPKNLEGSFSLLGEYGSVVIGGNSMNKFELINVNNISSVDIAYYEENPPDVYGFGHGKLYQEINKFITGENFFLVDGESGCKTIELLNAIYESYENGVEVKLPLVNYKGSLGK